MNKKLAGIIGACAAAVILGAIFFGVNGAVNNPQRLLSLGERYLLKMDYEQAAAYFERVIKIEPKNARAYLGAAEAYVGLGKTDRAVELLRLGLERTGDLAIAAFLATLEFPTTAQEESDTLIPPAAMSQSSTESIAPTVTPLPAVSAESAAASTAEAPTGVATAPIATSNATVVETPAAVSEAAEENPDMPSNISVALDKILADFETRDVAKTVRTIRDQATKEFRQYFYSRSNVSEYNKEILEYTLQRNNTYIRANYIQNSDAYDVFEFSGFNGDAIDTVYLSTADLKKTVDFAVAVVVWQRYNHNQNGEYVEWVYTFSQHEIRVDCYRGQIINGGYNGEVTKETIYYNADWSKSAFSYPTLTANFVDGYAQPKDSAYTVYSYEDSNETSYEQWDEGQIAQRYPFPK